MSNTPTLDKLYVSVRLLFNLVSDPHPGLISWNECLHERMKELVEWWTETESAQLSAVTKERDELRELVRLALRTIDPFTADTIDGFRVMRELQLTLVAALQPGDDA